LHLAFLIEGNIMTNRFTSALKPLVLAGLMASGGFAALAQNTPAKPPGDLPSPHRGMMHNDQRDTAHRQEMIAKHHARLKGQLKIAPEQEAAWTSFTNAMQPPADMAKMAENRRAMHDEMERLSTPERIDKMRALRKEHEAVMDKRADAVKTFYATLKPEQKTIFDALHKGGGRGGHGGHDGHHGSMFGRG
jgi:periplasmic protein CpxP/Spy